MMNESISNATSTLVLAAVLLASSTAAAQTRDDAKKPADAPRTPKEVVKQYDKDGDRRLSYDEFRAFQGNRYVFRQLDANDDGGISAAELSRRLVDGKLDVAALVVLRSLDDRSQVVDAVDFDANADGRINAKEFRAWVFALVDQNGDELIDGPEADYLGMAAPFNQTYYGKGEGVLKDYDRSKDGEITRAEFKLDSKWFGMLDRDGDRALAADELFYRPEVGLAAFANQDVDTLMERYDKDGDGELDPGEIPGGGGRSGVGRADADRDGKVSRDELNNALKAAQRAQFAVIDPSFIQRYDLNDDRKVTRKEFPGPAAVFSRLDRNGDGVVSKSDGS